MGDLLVGYNKHNFLFELKDPKQPVHKRKLTKDEALFQATFYGFILTVETVEEILRAIDYREFV